MLYVSNILFLVTPFTFAVANMFRIFSVFTMFIAIFLVSILPRGVTASDRYKPNLQVKRMLDRANQLVGTPYVFGGTSVRGGFDCSGFVVYLFRHSADIHLPRTTRSLMDVGSALERQNLRPGDLVFFNRNGGGRVQHVGLYLGSGRFIHSPRKGKAIRVDSLSNKYWDNSYLAARRVNGLYR